MRYKFVNGKRVLRGSNAFVKSNSSVGCSVPNRSYTVAELAERLAKGQPMPTLTFYREYDDYGHNQVFRPTDLIGVEKLAQDMKRNGAQIDKLKFELENVSKNNVSKPEISSQSDTKED